MEDGETVAGRTSSLLYGRPRTGLRTFRIINNIYSIENMKIGKPMITITEKTQDKYIKVLPEILDIWAGDLE